MHNQIRKPKIFLKMLLFTLYFNNHQPLLPERITLEECTFGSDTPEIKVDIYFCIIFTILSSC